MEGCRMHTSQANDVTVTRDTDHIILAINGSGALALAIPGAIEVAREILRLTQVSEHTHPSGATRPGPRHLVSVPF